MTSTKRQKWRIWKDVAFLSVSFMCLLTSFNLVANLQSSIQSEAGLGTTSQAVIYASLLLSSLFLPTLMMKKLGLKWTMVLCQFCYSAFIGAQFYPSFATLMPAAILLGFAAAPLWSAQSTYLTQMGVRLANVMGKKDSAESCISTVFGVSFMILQSSIIWGNLIGSYVLSKGVEKNLTETALSSASHCGSNFCPASKDLQGTGNATGSAGHPSGDPSANVTLLMGILLGIALMAALILAFLVDSHVEEKKASSPTKPVGTMLMATFHHMKNPDQLLLIPITLWAGCEKAFWTADFTFAFVSCSWGVENIGYVMISMGVAMTVSSVLFGYLVKRVGRIPFFILGAAINFSLLLAMQFFWNPDPLHPAIFFIMAALWGTASTIWTTTINAFIGTIFIDNKEAAFSNFRLWQALGLTTAFVYSSYLCVSVKLYILMGVLLSGFTGYVIVEIRERKRHSATVHKDEDCVYAKVAS